MGTIEIEIEAGSGAGSAGVDIPAIALAGLLEAQQPASLVNLAYSNLVASTSLSRQNATANQQAMNGLAPPIVAQAANGASQPGPLQARSAVGVLADNGLAHAIADLRAVFAALASPDDIASP